jgi:hypothetical protein
MDAISTNPKRTAAGNHLHQENVNGAADFVVQKVDLEKAATIRPSKMSGRNVAWLVTFVAGMGVSDILNTYPGSATYNPSSPCLVMTKVS